MLFNRLLVLSLLLILLLTACAGGENVASQSVPKDNTPESNATEPAEQELITLKMNSSAKTSFAPIFIADDEGYFEEAGIELEYITFNRSTQALPLVINGDIDVYAGVMGAGLVNVLGQEDSIKVVADRGHISPKDSCIYHGILFRKDPYDSGELREPADLAGRPVRGSLTNVSGYLLSLYLAQAGLTFDDVNVVDIPTTGYVEAMADGTLDAIVSPELNISKVMSGGNAVLAVNGADVYGSFQMSVVVFGKKLLVDNREAGVRFLTAYLRGVQQYNEGKTDRNVEIMANHTSESEELLRNACWVAIRNDGSIDFIGVDDFQQWSIEMGYLENPVTEDQLWDPSILEEALAALNR